MSSLTLCYFHLFPLESLWELCLRFIRKARERLILCIPQTSLVALSSEQGSCLTLLWYQVLRVSKNWATEPKSGCRKHSKPGNITGQIRDYILPTAASSFTAFSWLLTFTSKAKWARALISTINQTNKTKNKTLFWTSILLSTGLERDNIWRIEKVRICYLSSLLMRAVWPQLQPSCFLLDFLELFPDWKIWDGSWRVSHKSLIKFFITESYIIEWRYENKRKMA